MKYSEEIGETDLTGKTFSLKEFLKVKIDLYL